MWNRISLIEKLQEVHEFPCVYTFKIIVETHRSGEDDIGGMVRSVIPGALFSLTQRASSGGRFTSWSLSLRVESAHVVVALYERFLTLPGLKSLF